MSVSTLTGVNVVITGAIDGHTRTEAEAILSQHGAHVQRGITRATDVLIVGNNVGRVKTDKARSLGVPTITWSQALDLMRGAPAVASSAPPTAAPTRNQPVPAQAGYRQVKPMLCKGATALPSSGEWIYELKWDGYRCIAHVNGDTILASRSGKDLDRFARIRQELDEMVVPCILDGEIVILDEKGHSNFEALHKGDPDNAKFVVFDVLEAQGVDIRDQPLSERKQLLGDILEGGAYVSVSPTFAEDEADELLAYASENDLEGIVAKKPGSRYQEGARNESWLKIKLRLEQEFVIVGFTPGKGARSGVPGAALLAVNAGTKRKPSWLYCGCVGSGGTYDDWAELERAAAPETSPAIAKDARLKADFSGPELKEISWVIPIVVVQVKFQRWTSDGKLWHPSMQGRRKDKNPEEVTRES